MGKSPKKIRRARGTGSIFYSEARGCWIGRAVVGKAAGRTIYREVSAPTQGEVVRRLAALGPPDPKTTVADWAARWRQGWTQRPGTRADYAVALDTHILPAIGHVKLADVTPDLVERFGAALQTAGRAPGTAAKVVGTFQTMLSAAVRARAIPHNPAAAARKPRRPKTQVVPLTPDQLLGVIRESARYSAGGVLALMAAVGCRVGEALALDVGDYDPGKGTVSVTKTYDWKMGLGPTKSPHSVRTVEVPDCARPALVAAAGGRTEGPLFATRTGRRQTGEEVSGTFARVLKRLGLPRRRPHQLRHSVASHMMAAGVPPATVAEYIGDTVATVIRVYVHPTGVRPVAVLNRLFGGG